MYTATLPSRRLWHLIIPCFDLVSPRNRISCVKSNPVSGILCKLWNVSPLSITSLNSCCGVRKRVVSLFCPHDKLDLRWRHPFNNVLSFHRSADSGRMVIRLKPILQVFPVFAVIREFCASSAAGCCASSYTPTQNCWQKKKGYDNRKLCWIGVSHKNKIITAAFQNRVRVFV